MLDGLGEMAETTSRAAQEALQAHVAHCIWPVGIE
jgi:hypothetical protein